MRRVVVLVLAAALALTACSSAGGTPSASVSASGSIDDITIGSSDTLAPSLTFPPGDNYTRSQARVIWRGDGAPLVDNQPLLLDVYGVSLTDGTEVVNTFDGLPRSYVLAREVLGDTLYKILINQNVGSRVLVVAPPMDATSPEPSVALVVDVLSERAVGTPVPPRPDLPIVTVGETGEPQITIPKTLKEPSELQVATLIQGGGEQVQAGSYIVVNYKAVYWKDGSIFDSSWPTDKAPFQTRIGAGQVIRGWDEGLVDQTVGSQVLLVVPPAFGYPDKGTLVFVVDILDTWNPGQ